MQWGTMLAEAIRTNPEDIRVAILATGGLSHSIGEPTMGEVDEIFDRECIQFFEKGEERPLVEPAERHGGQGPCLGRHRPFPRRDV